MNRAACAIPFVLAIFFGLAETAYFGWNALPESDAEMVCDGIVMILLALGCLGVTMRKGAEK